MHIDDVTGEVEVESASAAADVRPIRLVSIHGAATPCRRRAPRRQSVQGNDVERRGPDRRKRRPGIDGLLRQVLSDNWE